MRTGDGDHFVGCARPDVAAFAEFCMCLSLICAGLVIGYRGLPESGEGISLWAAPDQMSPRLPACARSRYVHIECMA